MRPGSASRRRYRPTGLTWRSGASPRVVGDGRPTLRGRSKRSDLMSQPDYGTVAAHENARGRPSLTRAPSRSALLGHRSQDPSASEPAFGGTLPAGGSGALCGVLHERTGEHPNRAVPRDRSARPDTGGRVRRRRPRSGVTTVSPARANSRSGGVSAIRGALTWLLPLANASPHERLPPRHALRQARVSPHRERSCCEARTA